MTITSDNTKVRGNSVKEEFKLKNKYISIEGLKEVTVSLPKSENDPNEMVTIEKVEHRKDITTYITEDNYAHPKKIVVDFASILENANLEGKEKLFEYNIHQAIYSNIYHIIYNDLNYFLNEVPEIAYKLLNFKVNMFMDEDYTESKFIEDFEDFIKFDKLLQAIDAVVDSTYTISLDDYSRTNSDKIVPELQVTDESNKVLIRSAIMQRLLIPTICEYLITSGNAKNKPYNEQLFLKTFKLINRYFSNKKGINILTKISKIVEPRIKKTLYKDKVIWYFLQNISVDEDILNQKITDEIIRTIICKLSINKSSISYLDVVIKRKIEYAFRSNYALQFKVIKISSSDDDLDENDKFSLIQYHKHNEMSSVINDASIDKYVRDSI
ncbi:hypothetical protein FPHOBKDP_00229 [Listeria phage LPJP1]|nr:hypothetical protein FPHOBKDP_00229 [Listeria phage LPJP1]